MRKKIVFIVTIAILLSASSIPASETNKSDLISPCILERGVLYVGGQGPGNYTTIQGAINDAIQGDTIFVYNGTYNENINVNKRIYITGESKQTTMIQGVSGVNAVVRIVSNNVEIKDFTIIGNPAGQDGIHVIALMKDIYISDCIIKNCAYGIFLQGTSERVNVLSNHISDNSFSAIRLQGSDRNKIEENIIQNNDNWGISLESLSKQNTLSNNIVASNYGGIKLSSNSEQNDILGNTITDNTLEGLLIEGISKSNTIKANNITNNFAGVKLSASGQNIIEGNTIEANSMEGLLLESSNSNIISKNNFIDNKRHVKFRLSQRNSWEENYWDNWIGVKLEAPIFKLFPKVIFGFGIPNFD
ncbi:MAG: NosD domain-containing protein, partial [Thermoplasmatota archaeon]